MKFGLIGHPIAHSQSPRLFAEAFNGKGSYDLIEEASFDAAWQRFISGDYDGINVTAPFKSAAASAVADASGVLEPEVLETEATNFVVRKAGRLHAFNTDALAVLDLLKELIDEDSKIASVAIVGLGGAGRAALWAARQIPGISVAEYHHDEIASGITADVVIYTLPSAVPGTELIKAKHLLEANYLNPCCGSLPGVGRYISGLVWLQKQADLCWKRYL